MFFNKVQSKNICLKTEQPKLKNTDNYLIKT